MCCGLWRAKRRLCRLFDGRGGPRRAWKGGGDGLETK